MKVCHFIAIANTPEKVAWHYAEENKLDNNKIKDFLDAFHKKCRNEPLGIYRMTTNLFSWESVVKKDLFFEDVTTVTIYSECFIKFVADRMKER